MSEIINNREERQKVLKQIIKDLHDGKDVSEVKARFAELIKGVAPTEISEMEQALIQEGMPVEEVQRLCDVHAEVFKGSIEEIHRPKDPRKVHGHPLHTFIEENRAIEELICKIENKLKKGMHDLDSYVADIDSLLTIGKHYARKENLLFPYMEKYNITAPPKVMWGVDDEIRDSLKKIKQSLSNKTNNREELHDEIKNALHRIREMIFKEENILFPMVIDTFSEDEWLKVLEGSEEFGYTLITPKHTWKPVNVNVENKAIESGEYKSNDGYLKFPTGILLPKEIEAMLNTLPLDITFVNAEGIVKYFSQGKERIFPRPKTIIGREVKNCHPPASVHIVEKIVEDLTDGTKDHEDFWIKMGEQYVYIRYFAVRDSLGEFLGVVEVTQNIKPIQEITGEKRLVE